MHGTSKIIDTFETYQEVGWDGAQPARSEDGVGEFSFSWLL